MLGIFCVILHVWCGLSDTVWPPYILLLYNCLSPHVHVPLWDTCQLNYCFNMTLQFLKVFGSHHSTIMISGDIYGNVHIKCDIAVSMPLSNSRIGTSVHDLQGIYVGHSLKMISFRHFDPFVQICHKSNHLLAIIGRACGITSCNLMHARKWFRSYGSSSKDFLAE